MYMHNKAHTQKAIGKLRRGVASKGKYAFLFVFRGGGRVLTNQINHLNTETKTTVVNTISLISMYRKHQRIGALSLLTNNDCTNQNTYIYIHTVSRCSKIKTTI